jgi:hypothetical protein
MAKADLIESRLLFADVKKCKSAEEFSLFVRRYLAERGLIADGHHAETRKVYWALFYAYIEDV